MTSTVKIAIDVGGVLSKYPEIIRPIMSVLQSSGAVEVHILSDMPEDKLLAMLLLNDISMPAGQAHSCDYATHGEACKAVKAMELGIHVLIDDFVGYVATQGFPPVRLLVMPDASRPYYSDEWKTDGSEGSFGRVRSRTP